MFLSKKQILEKATELFPATDQFNPDLVREACYDLCVGDEVFLSEKQVPNRLNEQSRHVVLPPGQFALIKTFEEIFIPPELIGLLSIRSRYKFQGLINISGFHVDPSFRGHLIFSVQNVGPNDIRLEYKEPTFMLMFAELKPGADAQRKKAYDRIPLEFMAQLGGPSVNLATLKKELDRASLSIKIYGGLVVALLAALVAALFSRSH
jgi:dCTP deaminase